MFKNLENPAAFKMRPVILFLNAKSVKPAEIHRQLCDVYGEHAMSISMVRRWVRLLNEGRENVHDDPRSGRPSVRNEVLVRAVERRLERTDDSPLRHFPCIFLRFHCHVFTKLCVINLSFGNCCTLGAADAYGRTQIETAGHCVGLPDTIHCERRQLL